VDQPLQQSKEEREVKRRKDLPSTLAKGTTTTATPKGGESPKKRRKKGEECLVNIVAGQTEETKEEGKVNEGRGSVLLVPEKGRPELGLDLKGGGKKGEIEIRSLIFGKGREK